MLSGLYWWLSLTISQGCENPICFCNLSSINIKKRIYHIKDDWNADNQGACLSKTRNLCQLWLRGMIVFFDKVKLSTFASERLKYFCMNDLVTDGNLQKIIFPMICVL